MLAVGEDEKIGICGDQYAVLLQGIRKLGTIIIPFVPCFQDGLHIVAAHTKPGHYGAADVFITVEAHMFWTPPIADTEASDVTSLLRGNSSGPPGRAGGLFFLPCPYLSGVQNNMPGRCGQRPG